MRFFQRTQERVLNNRDKRAISVRATESQLCYYFYYQHHLLLLLEMIIKIVVIGSGRWWYFLKSWFTVTFHKIFSLMYVYQKAKTNYVQTSTYFQLVSVVSNRATFEYSYSVSSIRTNKATVLLYSSTNTLRIRLLLHRL